MCRIKPMSFYYCFIKFYGFFYSFADCTFEFLLLSVPAFATELALFEGLFIDELFIFALLELLFNFGWEEFRFIFLLLADFFKPFFDFDLAIDGLRSRLFLSRLVFGNFLFDLFNPPLCGLLDLLLDLLRFSLSLPIAFFYLLALISALTPLFMQNKYIVMLLYIYLIK